MSAQESGDWLLLPGPDAEFGAARPPTEQIVGAWPVLTDGATGRFVPNPQFQPGSPDTPTDPFDAASRLWARGELGTARLVEVLDNLEFAIAVDESGLPAVSALADGGHCVTVVTAAAQSVRSALPHWEQATLEDLLPILPEGARIAVNPDSATPVLLDLDSARSQ